MLNARVRSRPRWLIVPVALLTCLVAFAPPVPSLAGGQGAPTRQRGTPGVATRSAVVNFAELARQEALNPPPPRPPMAIHPPLRPPEERTGHRAQGKGQKAKGKGRKAKEQRTPRPLVPSPPPGASFLAKEDNLTFIPPDTHGAVGPNHLMVTLNGTVRIQDRMGGVISDVSLDTFWSAVLPPDEGTFDPRVLYDPFENRWMTCAASADFFGILSSLLLGVSQTADPTGNWNLYQVDADPLDFLFFDFPTLGFNRNWIVVTGNMFDNFFFNFIESDIYAFDKADLYAGGAGMFTMFFDGAAFTQQPAVTLDNTLDTMYLVQDFTFFLPFGVSGALRIDTITGPVGAEMYAPGVAIIDPGDPWEIFGCDAPQLGSPFGVATNDSRIGNVMFRNGSLWVTHPIFLPAFAPCRAAVQWWEISTPGVGGRPVLRSRGTQPDGFTIQQRGRIDDPTGETFYFFPSLAVNRNNDVLIGYSRSSLQQFVSANYSFRLGSDPPNTLRDDTVLKAGEAPYFKDFGTGVNRWGDYSNTVIDPLDDCLWTIQEFAMTPVNGTDRWGTWWGKICPPTEVIPTADLALTKSDAPDPVFAGSNLTYTLTVTNNGPDPATGVTLIDLLPPGVTFISCTASQGTCSQAGGVVTADLGALPSGGVATVTIVVRPNAPGEIVNEADVMGNEEDPDPLNNAASATTTVLAAVGPDLTGVWDSLTQTCRGSGARRVCWLNGTFTVQNRGGRRAGASVLKFFLSSDGAVDPGDRFLTQVIIGPRDPAKSQRTRLSVVLPPGVSASGGFVIGFVDATGLVVETDEANNQIVFGPVP